MRKKTKQSRNVVVFFVVMQNSYKNKRHTFVIVKIIKYLNTKD